MITASEIRTLENLGVKDGDTIKMKLKLKGGWNIYNRFIKIKTFSLNNRKKNKMNNLMNQEFGNVNNA